MPIEINGTGSITGVDSLSTPAVTNAAGSASAPSITFTGDTNTGLYSPGADQVAITTGGTGRLFVDSSGRVGVGTTSPSQKLHITDSSAAFTRYESGSFDAYVGQRSTGILEIAQAQAGNITLLTSGSERARINSSGTLLVGTTTEFSGFGMNGVSAGVAVYGAGVISLARGDSGPTGRSLDLIKTGTATGNVANFYYAGTTNVGNIAITATSASFNSTSDYRLKENVIAVTDGITRLQQLKPSRFNFIADPGHTVDGFIAHEVQTVVPEAITGEKDAVDDDGNPIYQGIDQSKLVPLLTAALQEAVAKIESLEARLTVAGI